MTSISKYANICLQAYIACAIIIAHARSKVKGIKSMAIKMCREYATVVYIESAPENWKKILDETMIEALISPLHDKDVYEEDTEDHKKGDLKKPHYHVMLSFPGKKNPETVKEIVKTFGGVGLEIVQSKLGMARYLCHIGKKDKAQYDIGDVEEMNGANYIKSAGLDEDPMGAVEEMMDFCEDNNINNFYVLARYARENRRDWHRILVTKSTGFIREYLKAKKWYEDKEKE